MAAVVFLFAAFSPSPLLAASDEELVEIPVWSRSWSGSIGDKAVKTNLYRVANVVVGRFCCEAACLKLRGTLDENGAVELKESDLGASADVNGIWTANLSDETVVGAWRSADGKETFPISLIGGKGNVGATFPYEIRMVASRMPAPESIVFNQGEAAIEGDVRLSALRLYDKEGRLIQELAAAGAHPAMRLPEIGDFNFDGWSDLRIVVHIGIADTFYRTWLFNSQTRRLEKAPDSLQKLASPRFDAANKVVWRLWNNAYGLNWIETYRWRNGALEKLDEMHDYMLPVLKGDAIVACDALVRYDNGRIVSDPRLERTFDGKVKFLGDIDKCDLELYDKKFEYIGVKIWEKGSKTAKPRAPQQEGAIWKKTKTSAGMLYCPEIPVYVGKEIRRILWDQDVYDCQDDNPDAILSRG